MELSEFLLARIAEDERAAIGVRPGPRTVRTNAPDVERFLAVWHPDRVLAECDAKRRVVDAYLDERSRRDVYQRDDAMASEDEKQRTSRRSSAARTRGLEIALEALALPYADHSDYREEWRLS